MITLTLQRTTRQGKAVNGKLSVPFDPDKPLTYDTLENADFLIPEGTYPLRNTWSPKFKKFMPEICDVPERTGIRIHLGTKPEHSTGCVLVGFEALTNTRIFIDRIDKFYENEELYIQIKQK